MNKPRKPMGELVAKAGDYKFYLYHHTPETGRGTEYEIITVVNKEMKFNMVKASTHTIELGFEFINKKSK